MKATSKDRQPNSAQRDRFNKTQQPLPPRQDLDNTNPPVQKKATMYEHPAERNHLPPRAGSSQKINYKIEDNMTNSKIQEAKYGLQLLKKKMVRTGLSRQKNDKQPSVQKQDAPKPRKVANKEEQYYGYEPEQKKTPQIPQKKQNNEPVKKTPPPSSKPTEDRPIPIRRNPPEDQYFNPVEEAPLKSNQDFMAILEREMAKENAKGQSQPIQRGAKKPVFQEPEEEEIELVECSKGCGRQFSTVAIAKHEKVCEKVFQSKRKVFNSAAHRQPEIEDFKAPPPPPPTREEKAKGKKPEKEKEKQGKVPKWKLQSAAFRAGIKAGRGQQLSAEQKAVTQQASGMVQCPVCSRKFNQQAGKRHIAFCESKAKQLPKMNTTKKR